MIKILPNAKAFNAKAFTARLALSGWNFAFGYAFLLAASLFNDTLTPAMILLLALIITGIDLAYVALTADYPHVDSPICRPQMLRLPRLRRFACYILDGAHWTTLMLGAFGIFAPQEPLGLLLAGGVFFTLATARLSERQLRATVK